ncbi:MAG: Gldg family protein [Pseudobacter sp.]|uniref:Gldg family protein n=1 Tax=Pseudobacter sp. TaxID=2045420 RepID=UPI003F814678
MKLIFKVARTELRNLFYSPVAWFLTIAFMVQCAIFYTVLVEKMSLYQEMLEKNTPEWGGFNDSLTGLIFLNQQGIFVNVLQNLFLFVPLLTMGLISREINNGTIKLLYSSPLKTRHLVLGKYLATMAYNLVLVGIVAGFVILGMLNIEFVDYGRLLSALLGFFLLVCAYTAIGIYMSSITTYQIVSAIATFTIIFALTYIGTLWQKYDMVRDLTYFLSMNGRASKFLSGLITTNDVVYFLVIIVMFLGFTLFRLKGAREYLPRYKKMLRYASLTLVCLVIGYFASKPGLIAYWDATRDDINTIHPRTQQIIERFDKNEPLEVTLYANVLGRGWTQGGLPEKRNEYRWVLWDPYLRFKPDIKFNYVTYYDIPDNDSTLYKAFPKKSKKEIAETIAKGIGGDINKSLPPDEIRKMIDLTPERMRLVMQLKYKGKTTFLRTFDDGPFWPNEMNVSAAFLRLQQDAMPKVLFTSGNLERSIYKTGEREFYGLGLAKNERSSLVNIGFDTDTINLDEKDIPADLSFLVVPDPKTELSQVKQEKVRRYIEGGGNAFVMTEPGKSQLVNPLLTGMGVEYFPGIVVQASKHEMPQMINAYPMPDLYRLAPEIAKNDPLEKLHKKKVKIEGEKKTRFSVNAHVFPGTVAIRQLPGSPFSKFNIYQTNPAIDTWIKMGQLVTDSVAPLFAPQEGDFKDSSFSLMAAFHRNINNKEQRVLISGDADFFSNGRGNGVGIALRSISWLDNNRLPNFAAKPPAIDRFLTISPAIGEMQVWLFLYILPALLLLLGIILLVRRKRK